MKLPTIEEEDLDHANAGPSDMMVSRGNIIQVLPLGQELSRIKRRDRDPEVEDVLKTALDIQLATKILEETFGGFTFLEAGNNLYTAVSGLFLSTLMFLPDSYDPEGNVHGIPFYMSIYAFLIAMHTLVRYLIWQNLVKKGHPMDLTV